METYQLTNGKTLEVIHDEFTDNNPRVDFDNLGTMVCFHNRYRLGDEQDKYSQRNYTSWEQLKKAIIKNENVAVILPIYMYDHSGITIRTTPFDCRWDSGQIGYIFISKEKALYEYGGKRVTKALRDRLTGYLINEVEVYDQYLRGDIYGFKLLNSEGVEEDSCWGFYGSDPMENGMMEHIDGEIVS
mgnify:CR=1 FL=1